MACDLERKLKERAYITRSLQLMLYLEDGNIHQLEHTLRQPTGDGERLGRALNRLLAQTELSSGVIRLDVRAADLQEVQWQQLELFGSTVSAQEKAQQLLGSLIGRFGEASFYQVTPADPDHRLPEARFHIERVDAA